MLDLPRQKKRWFFRWWFTIPVFVLLIVAITGAVIFYKVKWDYEAQALQFDYTRLEAMESASVILDRHGVLLGKIFTQNRDQVSLEHLSPSLLDAVVAAEDARFYEHSGVDVRGVVRSLRKLARGHGQAGREHAHAAARTQHFPGAAPAE